MRRASRCGSLDAMSTTDNTHPSHAEVAADVIEVTDVGLRVAEIGIAILIGLLVSPPLLILAVGWPCRSSLSRRLSRRSSPRSPCRPYWFAGSAPTARARDREARELNRGARI